MSRRIISFDYVVKGTDGAQIDSSENSEPITFLEGAQQIVPGVEEEVSKMSVGEKKNIFVPAAKAYGPLNNKLVMKVERDKLPEGKIEVGVQFRGGDDAHAPIFTVIKIEGESITLDGNHPLAGKDLNFDVEIKEIREASAEELSHGHAHGPDGHHHH